MQSKVKDKIEPTDPIKSHRPIQPQLPQVIISYEGFLIKRFKT